MKKNNSFKEIWDKLKKCKKVAMTLHYGPDGDSLGSCAAMKYVLERDFKCKVRLVSNDNLEDTLMALPYAKGIEFGIDISELNPKDYDAYVFMDSGLMSGKLRELYEVPEGTFLINIDHHKVNRYGEIANLNYIEENASSTCSILVEFFKSVNVKFDKELSTRLLLGIATDTGFFSRGDHGDINGALRDAVFLIDHGARYYEDLVRPVLDNIPLKIKKYSALLMTNLEILKINGYNVGYSYVTLKDITSLDLNEAEIRRGVGSLAYSKELDMTFILAENKTYIKGSFRSAKGIDVSIFAKELGGGGHKSAAAFSLPRIPLKDAEKKVISVLKKGL